MNPNAPSSEEIEIIRYVLRSTQLEGYGGKCGFAAIAINEVLFGEEGNYITISNRAFFDEGSVYGHIVVEFAGYYWDSRGTIPPDELEHWGWVSASDLAKIGVVDDAATKEIRIDSWPTVSPSAEERKICDSFADKLRETIQTLRVGQVTPADDAGQ